MKKSGFIWIMILALMTLCSTNHAKSLPSQKVQVQVYIGKTVRDCSVCHSPAAEAFLRYLQNASKARVIVYTFTRDPETYQLTGIPKGIGGVPAYVVYGPGTPNGVKFEGFDGNTQTQVMNAIEAASVVPDTKEKSVQKKSERTKFGIFK